MLDLLWILMDKKRELYNNPIIYPTINPQKLLYKIPNEIDVIDDKIAVSTLLKAMIRNNCFRIATHVEIVFNDWRKTTIGVSKKKFRRLGAPKRLAKLSLNKDIVIIRIIDKQVDRSKLILTRPLASDSSFAIIIPEENSRVARTAIKVEVLKKIPNNP